MKTLLGKTQTGVTLDSINKKIVMTGMRYQMIFDYNFRAVVTSLKIDSMETLETDEGIYSSVKIQNTWVTTKELGECPDVIVSQNIVSATLNTAIATEIWIFTVSDTDIKLKLTRSYNIACDIQQQGTPEMDFENNIFENIRWKKDGANSILKGLIGFLSGDGTYGISPAKSKHEDFSGNRVKTVEDTTFTLLSGQSDNLALAISSTSSADALERGIAVEVDRKNQETDLALGKAVYVSLDGEASWQPIKYSDAVDAIDVEYATDRPIFKVDLGSIHEIMRVDIYLDIFSVGLVEVTTQQGDIYLVSSKTLVPNDRSDVTVEVSTDEVNWVEVVSNAYYQNDMDRCLTYQFGYVNARFVKVKYKSYSSLVDNSILSANRRKPPKITVHSCQKTLRIRTNVASQSKNLLYDTENLTNIAPTASISVSSTLPGYSAFHVTDECLNTSPSEECSWASDRGEELPCWVRLDFDREREICGVDIYTSIGYEVEDYKIQYLDGANWVDLVNKTGNKSTSNSFATFNSYRFDAVSCRAVRFLGIRGPDAEPDIVRLNEFKVYEQNDAAFPFDGWSGPCAEGYQVFKDVHMDKGETVWAEYSFRPDDYGSYYDIGAFNGFDTAALSHALNDYGRMMIMGYNYGTFDEGPYWRYQIPALEQHWHCVIIGVLGDEGSRKAQANCLTNIKNYIQNPANGHIPIPEVLELPGKMGWGCFYPDMQPGYVIAAADLYAITGDNDWLESIKLSLEKALDFALDFWCDRDTRLVRNSGNIPHAGYPIFNNYWEQQKGAIDGYSSAMLYEALVKMAELERYVLDDDKMAEKYECVAQTLKESYNKDKADGGCWLPEINAVMYGSDNYMTRFLPAQAAAIHSGILPPDRIRRVVEGVERDTKNFNLDFHITNVIDNHDGTKPAPLHSPYINAGMNGGWYGAPDGLFYAGFPYYNDREKIPNYIRGFIKYYNKTKFIGGTCWERNGVVRADPEFLDTGMIFPQHVLPIASLYQYAFGFQPQYNTLVLAPFISSSMVGSKVKYNWRGCDIRVKYDSLYGYIIDAPYLPTPIKIRYINQTPEKSYIVIVDGIRQDIKCNVNGNVEVEMLIPGVHFFELTNPDVIMSPPSWLNIAKDKPTSASGTYQIDETTEYWPEKSTDGDISSGWLSDGNIFPAWLCVDLGANYPIGKVILTFSSDDVYKYRIEGANSLYEPSWFILTDRTVTGAYYTGGEPVIELLGEKCCEQCHYIRIFFTGTENGTWANLREIEIYTPD